MAATAASNSNGYFSAVLGRLGIRPTASTLSFLNTWAHREGVPQNIDSYNLLGTTQPEPGSHGTNGPGVQDYPTYNAGVAATASTIANQPAIKAALASGNPESFQGNGAAQRSFGAWSGGGYTWPTAGSTGPVALPASPPRAPRRLQQPTGARPNALASLSAELLGQTAPAAPAAAAGSPLERLSAELLGSPIAAAPKTPKPRAAPAASPVAPANVFQRSGPLNLTAVPQQLDTRPGIQVDAAILPSVEDVARQFAVKVNSGYRSPDHNAAVGGAPHSDHLTGDAVDFTGSPAALRALYKYAQGRYPYVEPWSQTGGSHDHISFRR